MTGQRPRQRRRLMVGVGGLVAALLWVAGAGGRTEAQSEIQKIRFGFGTKAVSPIVINFLIPEYLGYYKQEGLSVEAIPLGSAAAVMTHLESNRVQFGVGAPAFQLPLVARGEKLTTLNFFEYTYPFKWAVAVKPDSPIKTLGSLKGKKIGVSNFGVAEFPIARVLVRLVGFDPDKDVSWLAVGEGITAGQALLRGDIDALVYYDTGFGALEAAGIEMRYLPLPPEVPKVGGFYIMATREVLRKHRSWAVGLARAVARAQLFVLENPEAASYVFLRMFPESAPKGKSLEAQVKAVMVSVVKRMPLYRHYDRAIEKWGYISASEWEDEVEFLNLKGKIKDTSIFFTNELIDEINRFDASKVKAEAHEFKLPYKAR